ncbi:MULTISPECIES: CPBP family intramembrane glutamic endopeptidase [Aequorivita]|uniref:CPBP family intramembrane metalloprotease n=1 Tax=Aequorivita iocasae TaxID=2803865 RepID=A0ABX7DRE5_9FLAO|nr:MULTISPECIES: CPBP family intramembrane glutamic endopeptidase [Aequorivita]QQX76710.1 CPBP family intramembrane metalloprotease [Aequorivita iocasae]UCA56182.1 CPBP family intramembrane metalloprotease [Aequorivita sp. F7]
MYIQQAFKSLHEWWRYLVGFIIIFVASQLGSIPLLIAVMFKKVSDGESVYSIDENEILTTLSSNLTLFLMLLSFAVGLLAVYLVVKFFHKQPFVTLTTSRKKTDWGRVLFGFGLITVTTLVVTILDFYSNPEGYVLQFDLVPFLILAAIAVIMIPLQTSFEEYLFRGYLMQGIGVLAKNKWLPLIITSVVFGGLHLANPEVEKLGNVIMIYYIGTGFFLGIMTLMDEGMELALGFHAGNNLITALLVTADWTVFKTNSILKDISEPSAGFDVIAPVLILYPIFLLIMAWRYKWRDWGGKLFGKVEEPIVLSEENTPNSTFVEK